MNEAKVVAATEKLLKIERKKNAFSSAKNGKRFKIT